MRTARALGICAALAAAAPGTLGAQRAPVLRQVKVPHRYYCREMLIRQVTSGPGAASWSPDGRELVLAMQGSLWRQAIGRDTARQLTDGPWRSSAATKAPRRRSWGHADDLGIPGGGQPDQRALPGIPGGGGAADSARVLPQLGAVRFPFLSLNRVGSCSLDGGPVAAHRSLAEAWLMPRDTTDNLDSPAVWHGPDGQHWLLSTAKYGDVLVVNDAATGAPIGRLSWAEIARRLELRRDCAPPPEGPA